MQTSVSDEMGYGREGMIADTRNRTVETRVVEADLPAGRFVVKGTVDKGAILPSATGNITNGDLLGVTVFDSSKEYVSATHEYEQYDTVPVLRKGTVWMMAEDACTEGDAVFVRFTAGAGEECGRVRSDADTADAVAAPSCVFRSSTTSTDELILVEVNLPGAIA